MPAEPEGKQQHVVEVLNTVDTGTSVLLDAHARTDYTMATAIEAVAQTVEIYGLPDMITFDRDQRFVGTNIAGLSRSFADVTVCIRRWLLMRF